jgi:hypothetical protein
MYIKLVQLKEIPVGTRVIEERSYTTSNHITQRKAIVAANFDGWGEPYITINYELSKSGVSSCSTLYFRNAIDETTIKGIGRPIIKFKLDTSNEECKYSYNSKTTN